MENFLSVLHVIPVFLIMLLPVLKLLSSRLSLNFNVNVSSVTLFLSAIGIAAGYNVHHHHHGGFDTCYVCFFYSFALIIVGVNLLKPGLSAKFQKN